MANSNLPVGRPRSGSRLQLGIVLSDSSEDYQATVLQGARDAAVADGAVIRSFAGGNIGTGRRDDEQRNRIFDFVRTDTVDGLIILTGAISDFCTEEHVTQFCKRFRDIPACTVGDELPDFPSVRGDNRSGVRSAVAHLVKAHGLRRIGFIRGPLVNRDATERYQAYVDALAEHGIPLEPARVANGEYSAQSGAAAVAVLLDRQLTGVQDLDALMAADDSTALGAMGELARRRIHVPEQVAVIGFDDVQSARTASPPLATVTQQVAEQGAAAARIVLRILRGQPIGDSRVVLPAEVVPRRSCGCRGEPTAKAAGRAAARTSNFEAQLLLHRPLLRVELRRAARGAFSGAPNWDDQLIAKFVEQLKTGSKSFLDACRALTTGPKGTTIDQVPLTAVLGVLRTQMLSCVGREDDLRLVIEQIFEQALVAAAGARRSRTTA
jgi:DNA-binding LacI/PurR family transcriptional regulator